MPLWLIGAGRFLKSIPLTAWIAAAMAIVVLVLAWQVNRLDSRNDALEQDVSTYKARSEAAERTMTAMRQAEIQRQMDTASRTEETEKTNDALDRIEQQVADKKPVATNAAAVAVACSRLRRQGDTASAAYRAKCG
jgi:hypothetical protein